MDNPYDKSANAQPASKPDGPKIPGVGQTRVFYASGIREAFTKVKQAIGADAIILGTRDTSRWEADPERRYEIVAAYPNARDLEGPSADGEQAIAGAKRSPPPLPVPHVKTPPANLRLDEEAPLADQLSTLGSAVCSLQTQLSTLLEGSARLQDELTKLSSGKIGADAEARASDRAAPLVAAGIEPDVAERLVSRALRRAAPRRGIAVARKPDLGAEIERTLKVEKPLWRQPSGSVCALIGPTGAGKTTTLLKIAARAAYQHHRTVAVVSTDVHRLAVFEVLSAYAEVIGIPVRAAADRMALEATLEELVDVDLILIDTPGHNPFDALTRAAVMKPLSGREVSHHLVLPATIQSHMMADIIACYAGPALQSLVLTKVDEARGMGAVVGCSVAADIPVSHITDGQNIPDDIHEVDRRHITRQLVAQAS